MLNRAACAATLSCLLAFCDVSANADPLPATEALEQRVDELELQVERLSNRPPTVSERRPLTDLATHEEVEDLRGDLDQVLDALPDVTLSGALNLSYGFNFNRPADGMNPLRAFDVDDNTFRFDLARLTVATRLLDHAEARIDVLFGQTARILGEATRGSFGGDDVEMEQAFVSYRVTLGEGVDLTFGKFTTLLGAEAIEAPDNDHYSRSLLFTWAIPRTHTGLLTHSTFFDGFADVAFGVVNGWDAVSDGNDAKTVIGRVATRLGPRFALAVAATWGAEQEGRNGPKRWVVDTVATLRPLDDLSLLVNIDYGFEEDVVLDPEVGRTADAEWFGIGGSLRWDLAPILGLAVRGEYFRDVDGSRTGLAQDLWEITGTASFEVISNLVLRLEFRHDESDQPSFDKAGSPTGTQDTVSVDISYRF